jgi:hypothetical protein
MVIWNQAPAGTEAFRSKHCLCKGVSSRYCFEQIPGTGQASGGLDNITCKTDVGQGHKPGKESREYITVFLRDILAEGSNFKIRKEI